MRVVRLQTQSFQRVTAVDITPTDPLVTVRGNNAEGKSSLLDSIKVALGGASVAPIKPIQTGQEFAAIRLELGDGKPDIIVEKYFDEVGEKLKITTADGYKASQTDVNKLLGRMTFDPLAFSKKNAADQASELLAIAPPEVDLAKMAADDKADVVARRDVGRDAKALKARIDPIAVDTDLPAEKPDLDALTAKLASAADTNSDIAREKARRDTVRGSAMAADERAAGYVATAARLRREADDFDQRAKKEDEYAASLRAELDGLPPLAEPVDTTAARTAIDEARDVLERFARNESRARMVAEYAALQERWAVHDKAIKDRAQARTKALGEIELPVEGLGLARRCDVIPGDESEDLIVMYQGEPFAQASSAQQLRVSMRLAMAANPRLRIMIIKDGSLLDPKGMELVRELAVEGDYQVWLEAVGEGDGSGIIMEAGSIRGAPAPEALDPPKRRQPKGEGVVVMEAAGRVEAGDPVAVEDGKARSLVEGRDGLGKAAPSDPPPAPSSDAPPPRRRRAMPTNLDDLFSKS